MRFISFLIHFHGSWCTGVLTCINLLLPPVGSAKNAIFVVAAPLLAETIK